MSRDPKLTPQAGDVLRKNGFHWIVLRCDLLSVVYFVDKGRACQGKSMIEEWRTFMANAEVIHAAE